MAPTREFMAMKLLSKTQVRDMVLYSPAHIARLEADGRFPKRVKIGNGRVGWVDREVEDWILARIAERDRAS
jgi:prophage regulatory protein